MQAPAITSSAVGHLPTQQLQQANAASSERGNEDAFTSVAYKRRRTSKACIVCARKKVKCCGNLPCGPCVAMGESCSFTGEPRTAPHSLEARVKLQEARIARLEALLISQGATLDSLPEEDQLESKRAAGRLSSVKMQLDRILAEPEVELELGNTPSPSEKAGVLRPDARGNLRYIGAASTTSILIELDRIQREALPSGNLPPSRMSWLTAPLGLSIAQALPPPAGVELPDRDLADKLINVFFEQLQPLYPILHRPTFMREYEILWKTPLHRLNPMKMALVFAVLACASPLVDDRRAQNQGRFNPALGATFSLQSTVGVERNGVGFYGTANILVLHGVTDATLEQVQTYALFALFLCNSNCAARAWIVLGQAIRFAVDLGLHRSLAQAKLPKLEKERRRRAFWSLYTIDRLLAANLGRPLSLQEGDIDAERPLETSDEELDAYCTNNIATPATGPNVMTGFVALIDVHRIAGEAAQYLGSHAKQHANVSASPKERQAADVLLRSQVTRREEELAEWLQQLPKHLSEDIHLLQPPFLTQRIIAYSTYYATTLLLHLPLLPQNGIAPTEPQRASLARCIRAANSIVAMAPSVVTAKFPPSPHLLDYSQHLLVAGGLLLLVLTGGVDESVAQQLRAEVDRCAEGLEALEQTRFAGMRACHEMLVDLIGNLDKKMPTSSLPSPSTAVPAPLYRPTTGALLSTSPSVAPPSLPTVNAHSPYDPNNPSGLPQPSSVFYSNPAPPASTSPSFDISALGLSSFGGGLSPNNLPSDFFETLFNGGMESFSFPMGEAAFTEVAAPYLGWLPPSSESAAPFDFDQLG
ncbi:fungal-specific transcription factor domain-domain-containing protein [Leucosporidium creatinivorum]|uniref:Fungal-specific transcription factor domain-domain-containing protein n=1 Tax=Leucosporidium creatinivorum TaxID=106004 RepID=A0A1Y2DES1_9BASI|nr:fungal-specific transcription factor domain-domain-containing protein [Leucosporidium creatinivorum]